MSWPNWEAQLLVLEHGTVLVWVLFNTTDRTIYNIHLFRVDKDDDKTILLDAIYASDDCDDNMDGEFFEFLNTRCEDAGLLMTTDSGYPDWDVSGEELTSKYPMLTVALQEKGLLMI